MNILLELNRIQIFQTIELFKKDDYIITANLVKVMNNGSSYGLELDLNENYISPLTTIKVSIPIIKREIFESVYENHNNKCTSKVIDTENITFEIEDKTLIKFISKNKIQNAINQFIKENISEIKYHASNQNSI